MKFKTYSFLFIALFFCGCRASAEEGTIRQKETSKTTIRLDDRFKTVQIKAEVLLRTGLNAGDGYKEIWIRDLNTFIELACKVGNVSHIRESLLTFFKFQGSDGNIVDGFVRTAEAHVPYDYIYSDLAPGYAAHKNTVETDQESSLIQAIAKYIRVTGDDTILNEEIGGRTVSDRINSALMFLLNNRFSSKYGLLWGGTTVDWGDVQAEHEWGVKLDESSHLAIDIYDNAMFLIALDDYIDIADKKKSYWAIVRNQIYENIRTHLWDTERHKFIPHLYLDGSPFPADFDENKIHYHGGTAVAVEAGLLSKDEILTVYKQMQENVKAANAQSIGLTVYPPYPNGYFKNTFFSEYSYQNGGDWTWFGGRMVQQLIIHEFYDEALEAISPMLDRVIHHDGFYEWWTPSGRPNTNNFRGSAGVLWKAIQLLEKSEEFELKEVN